jgi:uncharacterized membrane protein
VTVQATAGDDSVSLFQVRYHIAVILLLFLLGSDQQEIKNNKHQDDRDKSAKSSGTFSAASTQCICNINQNNTSFI